MSTGSRPERASGLMTLVRVEGLLALALFGVALAVTPRCPSASERLARVEGTLFEPTSEPEEELAGPPVERVVVPTAWKVSDGDDCHQWHGKEVCDGPRKVPRPTGAAAALAKELGLGGRLASHRLLNDGPPPEWIAAARAKAAETFHWPARGGKLWRLFRPGVEGDRRPAHNGVDIGAEEGTFIVAAADGLVAYSDNRISGYGNVMLVIHATGNVALYSHCRATYVFAGQRVRAGQVIGEVGNTGISRAPHLHFELRRGGEPQDPLPWVRHHLLEEQGEGSTGDPSPSGE